MKEPPLPSDCLMKLRIKVEGIDQGGLTMSKKVLVVDDDPDVRTFVVTVCETDGSSCSNEVTVVL